MQFVQIEARNFKSFETLSVSLDNHGFVKIDGVNNTDEFSESVGSGKSTIADALSYALTGETVKGNSSMSDIKNMYTSGTCSVTVDFEHEGVEYRVIRGEGELSLFENGANISKHVRRDTQALIVEKFPFFTPTFLGATVIIGQNMPNSFTNNKPSARKQILEELTNSSFMIEEIKTMLAERKSEWQSEVGELSTHKVVLDSKAEAARANIERAKSVLSGLRPTVDIESDIALATEAMSGFDEQLSKLQLSLSAHTEKHSEAVVESSSLAKKLDAARVAHSNATLSAMEAMLAEKSGIEKSLAELRAELGSKRLEQTRLNNEIQRLKSAPTHCPTCKQALPDAHTLDTAAQEADLALVLADISKLVSRVTEIENSLNPVLDKISLFQNANKTNPEIEALRSCILDSDARVKELAGIVEQRNAEIVRAQRDLGAKRDLVSQLRIQLSEVDTKRKGCLDDIARAESEIKSSESDKRVVDKALDAKQERLSVLNQVISFATRDFRTILLTSIIQRLDAYAKAYCNKMLNTTDISFKDDGNNISISFRGRDFGILSGGESQVAKMCITLALKKTLEDLVGFTTNIMFFDEVLDNCDKATAQQIVELTSGLELGSMFFITHHEDVYLPVDKTWTVTKTNNISVLEVI